VIDPSGKFLDVTNNVGGDISVFTINASTNASIPPDCLLQSGALRLEH